MIEERKDQLMSEVFDLLLSMADFETFRDLMHSYKAEEEANKEEMAGGGGGGGVGGDSFLLPPLLKPSSSPDPIAVTTGGKVGGGGGNKGGGLRVSVQALKVHAEEQEDGEERPDLNGFALTISSPQSSRPK